MSWWEYVLAAVLSAVIGAAVGAVVTLIQKGGRKAAEKRERERKETDAMREGLEALLRAEIIRQNEKWTERGYFPAYAREALTAEFESYKALGGNGSVKVIYEQTMSLPPAAPKDKKTGG